MASTLSDTPSLLKEQCLQYLIDHLEDIPVEALALLPTAIRHTLAVHLPVADILQLEQTRFAAGLDMPGVWMEVRKIRHLLSRYPMLKEMFDSEIGAKEFVVMVVAYEAFHCQEKLHYETEKHHYFQAKPPRIPGPPVFFSPVCIGVSRYITNYAVPSRFICHVENRCEGCILNLLSTRYHINPERLYIDCNSPVGVAAMMDVLPRLFGLKQLSISFLGQMRVMRRLQLFSACMKGLTTLCKDIQTHTSLHSCSLRQWPAINGPDSIGTICSFFEQPQFQCLTLTETYLSLEIIQKLVDTFLTTPCNGPQILKLDDIHIHEADHTAPSVHDTSFLLHKSLVLDCHIGYYDRKYLEKWLSSICELQLQSLTVTNDYSHSNYLFYYHVELTYNY